MIQEVDKSKIYNDIIEHRNNCEKFNNKPRELCFDCFGGGLNKFVEGLLIEGIIYIRPVVNRKLIDEVLLIRRTCEARVQLLDKKSEVKTIEGIYILTHEHLEKLLGLAQLK